MFEFEVPRAFVSDAQSVLFFAHHGARPLRCYVTRQALVARFGASDAQSDEDGRGCLQAYDEHREEIRALAWRKFQRSRAPGGALVIDADDIVEGPAGGTAAAAARHG
ncbi:MAG: DUF1488 family protein [Burkholderiales bacterium]|nr:DUF1488 family protein [Burkholderiales bacterium]